MAATTNTTTVLLMTCWAAACFAVMLRAGRGGVMSGMEKSAAAQAPAAAAPYAMDITTAEANDWTVAMTLVFPVIASITGLVIWVRRKHA